MMPENKKYRRLLEILRESKPIMPDPDGIENEIIRRIKAKQATPSGKEILTERIFGWAYIGWVRRSLVAACVLVILVFVYQQTVILSQVKKISRQSVVITNELRTSPSEDAGRKLTILRLSKKLRSADESVISGEQLGILIRSYDEMESKYRNLLKIINEDPELKTYIEKRLNENLNKRSDL